MSSSSLRESAQQTSLRVQGLGLVIYRVMQGRLLHIPLDQISQLVKTLRLRNGFWGMVKLEDEAVKTQRVQSTDIVECRVSILGINYYCDLGKYSP